MRENAVNVASDEYKQLIQDAKRWKEDQWRDYMNSSRSAIYVDLDCSYPGCNHKSSIECVSSTLIHFAEKRAKEETWYCHYHKHRAWQELEEVSHELLPYLFRLLHEGPCSKARTGLNRARMKFLEEIGLIELHATQRGKNTDYDVMLSARGQQYLQAHIKDLQKYMLLLPAEDELEYWVPAYGYRRPY
jgi:hypothetical protein